VRKILQPLLGLLLASIAITACVFLGYVIRGEPSLRTILIPAALIVAAQYIASVAFRRGLGLALLVASISSILLGAVLLCTSFPFFWETRYPDGSYPMTWRSGVVFLSLMLFCMGFATRFLPSEKK
jgi:hypothetical protein